MAKPPAGEDLQALRERFGGAISDVREALGEVTAYVDPASIVDVCRFLRDDPRFEFNLLSDLCGVDLGIDQEPRFEVVYHLYSIPKGHRLRLKVQLPADDPEVATVTGVWKTANWHERETFDMFGIEFSGHPNLERILMWDGFNGFPLRKDFPIRGIDTGARIYPEVFPEGGGPKAGSTGKPVNDVNLYKGEWKRYGTWPAAQIGGGGNGAKAAAPAPKPAAAAKPAVAAAPPEEEA